MARILPHWQAIDQDRPVALADFQITRCTFPVVTDEQHRARREFSAEQQILPPQGRGII
jgi:hypothetical protein